MGTQNRVSTIAPAAKRESGFASSSAFHLNERTRSGVKQILMEAALRFELRVEVLQTSALPLGYAAPKGSHFS